MGVPLTYTDEMGKEICLKLATCGKGLQRLCAENPHWPCHQTIYEWRLKVPEFGAMFDKAKKAQVALLADECIDIADDSGFDAEINENGKVICNSEAINRARLRIDVRKWMAAKLEPRVYGDNPQSNEKPNDDEVKKAIEILNKCVKPIL